MLDAKHLRMATVGALSLFVAAQGSANPPHEVNFDVMLRSDDNAYKLPTAEQSGTAMVVAAEYGYKSDINQSWEVFGDAGFELEKYDADASDADEDTVSLSVGAEHTRRFSRLHKLKSEFTLYYDRKDQTYVSRATGLVPVVGTEDLADRFDYRTTGFQADFDYYFRKDWKFSLDIDIRDKDYTDDYKNLGLTRFDYKERRITPAVRYELGDQWQFTLSLPFRFRQYVDRRAPDLQGIDIANSDLEYDYRGYEFEIAYAINSQVDVGLSYENIDRDDNHAGALDYKVKGYKFDLKFVPDEQSEFSLSYESKDRDYRHAVSSTNPLELRSAAGDTLKVAYQRLLMRDRVENLKLTFDYRNLSRNHTTPTFDYDQRIVQVGVRKEF